MHRPTTLIALLALVALTALPVVAEGDAAPAAEDVTKTGTYAWEREDKTIAGDLKAIFTPVADGEWKVAFHFDWDDGPHVYAGTAKGNLNQGELSGEVENDNEERKATFRFTGTVRKGTFNGTHAVLTKEGELKDMGKLTLK